MKNKKAVSLSMNTVIIAVLAVVVLVVLIYLLTGNVKNADDATKCVGKGGICYEGSSCPGSIYTKNVGDEFCPDGQTCCVPGNPL